MSAPTSQSFAPDGAPAAAVALTLLGALARAPAAAALVVAALDQLDDRRALRLAHPQLRDAVAESITSLQVDVGARPAAARPPTPRRWPRLGALTMFAPDLAALAALGAETWAGLRSLRVIYHPLEFLLDVPAARALAAALRRMPALCALDLESVALPDAAAAELFLAGLAPELRAFTLYHANLTPAAARALAAAGWRLEELNVTLAPLRTRVSSNSNLRAAALAALAAAPTVALRRLSLVSCSLDAAALLCIARASWPLEELNISWNDLRAAAAAPALAALSRHRGLRRLNVGFCALSAAGFKALAEASWPALTSLNAAVAAVAFDGPRALGAAAFAGLPALEELDLSAAELGEAGAALLASRRWPRLRVLNLFCAVLGDAGLAALARGIWPALEWLSLERCSLTAPATLEGARRWAPALAELRQ